MNFIIPLFITLIVLHGFFKKQNVFSDFCLGAKDGIKTAFNVFPSILGLVVGVGMLKSSGFFDILSNILTPFCNILNIPSEIIPMAILRPLSGSGAFSILNNIFETTGVDSFPSLCASVMSGATETTFYTLAVYYGATGVTKTRHNVFCSVTADVISFILAVLTVSLVF